MALKPSKKILFWGKIVVFAGLVAYIGHILQQQPFDGDTVHRQLRTVSHPGYWAAGLLLLTPINWGFEALKWQILLRRVQPVSLIQAYQGVLAGVSLGFALPAQLGDTAGRVLSLRAHRTEAVGASLVSGGMQFYVAIVFGAIAWPLHLAQVPERSTPAGITLVVLLALLSGLGIGFGLVRRPLLNWLERRTALRRFTSYWIVAQQYDDWEIAQALGVAALRYLTFSLQFYLALRLIGIVLPPDVAAAGIGLVFLVKTIAPAFNLLSDLGIREAAALWVFTPFGISASVLLTTTLTLWLVNVLLPVLIGLIWVWKLKLQSA
ncbi:lysylphosphatidylglycerol synthase transmembrane domain-containing protein [Spirosoma sp. KUDC1026]|uniref:lysylphosphatidylglycerol synthase transmembrane domain-containing protein n=1 Tax=Spirosoma sp. KUDC1026 TaxID=2745947 RepID=UPI00159BC786|nr:lysylphosphatidylglycerol synthase transmembrane domain-containing protein [Spirosoma sp. KUDC1026]QKZ14539.1 flippase-like domain-containing protein [Spirosoma sp. KUDC1026]